MERIDLAAPIRVSAGFSTLEPVSLLLDLKAGIIVLNVEGANGEGLTAIWSDAAGEGATATMRALNKANLSTKSLFKRAMEKALADGKFGAGTISGTPD